MPVNPGFVGRVYPPAEPYLVGREKVREFARAVGETSPLCHDPAAARAHGHADVVAPPTFAFVLAMDASRVVVSDPDLGLDYSRVVHGEERFSYRRPIIAGDELVVTTTIEAIRSAAGNDLVTTRADIATTSGEPVVTAYTLLVSRGPEEPE
jgi:acyl dehydratase